MLTIINPTTNRQTDYAKSSLAREAKYYAKHATDSDGKVRGWSIVVLEGRTVSLRVDYLRNDGTATCLHVAL